MLNSMLFRAGILLILTWAFAPSCSKQDDARVILRLIQEGAGLAEAHRVPGLLDLTSNDFEATPGALDRRETGKVLWLAFRHYGDFKILYPQPTVDFVSREVAKARVYFLIVKNERTYPALGKLYKDPEGWLQEVGENADLYRLTLGLVRMDKDWLVKTARLEPFKGLGFGR